MSSRKGLSQVNKRKQVALPVEQSKFSDSVEQAMKKFRAKNRPKKEKKVQPSFQSLQGPVKQVDEKCRVIPWPAREII